ncbi:hypothetical protein [Tahibacter caeni]|uniref:hypothetical protein n=1 Tax=Tahibacter caeni TaxID=1453545 RepID=UPI00214944E1|nr:hypothetical protein [Tahibacter caeni]
MKTNYLRGALAALLLGAAAAAPAQDGALDLAFGEAGQRAFAPDGEEMHELRFNAAATLPDGSILLAGYRHKRRQPLPQEPDYRVVVAKLQPDGKVDESFGGDPLHPGLIVYNDFSPGARIEEAKSLAPLLDGGAIVAGHFEAGSETAGFTMKIDAAGALSQGYGERGIARLPASLIDDVAVDPQGRILVAGQQRGQVPLYRGFVARLDAAGAPDAGFGGDGVVAFVEMQDDQPVDNYGGMRSVAPTADGGIVVGGWQGRSPFVNALSLARLNADGTFDRDFAGGGWAVFEPGWISSVDSSFAAVEVLRDGRIVAAGDYMDEQGSYSRPFLARFTAQGRADAAFGAEATPGYSLQQPRKGFAWQRVTGLAVQNDGRLVYTATANDFSPEAPGPAQFLAGRVLADGAPDAAFGDAGVALLPTSGTNLFSDATALTLQSGRAIVVGNHGYPADGNPPMMVRGVVSRLQADAIFTDGLGG